METSLIDIHGRPLASKKELVEEQATPTITGVRSAWHEGVASGLTPTKLARILKDSMEAGADPTDFLTLAEEMEEREPQYRMALTQRKLALRNIECVVEAASEDDVDKEIAQAVRKVVDTTAFRNVIVDLSDALAKGYSVSEIVWNTKVTPWLPSKILWRDQRHFQFDKETGTKLRLREDGNEDGLELSRAKYICHVPKLKSGSPLRQGLARPACWIFMLKSFSLKDWMSFLEVYGMPFRVGKYGPGATKNDKRALLRAVANVAADGGAIIPDSMVLEFIETKANASGDNAFKGMVEYLDDQFAKLIIGQTMTSSDGSSKSQAEVHDDIRIEIKRADADDLAATIQRDFVDSFVMYNWGERPNGPPQATFPVPDPEDLKLLMEATTSFVSMGGKVAAAPVREKLGWRDPEEGEELLSPPNSQKSTEEAPNQKIGEKDKKETTRQKPSNKTHTHNLAFFDGSNDDEDFTKDMLSDWEPQIEGVLKKVRSQLEDASSLDDFLEKTKDINLGSDLQAIVDQLAASTFVTRIEGQEGSEG